MIHLAIAGVALALRGEFELPAHCLPFCTDPAPDALVIELRRGELPLTAPKGETQTHAGVSKLVYERVGLRFSGDARRAQATFDGSEGGLEAVLQLALQRALLEVDGLLVHGSAGVHAGGAWLMPGPSGTGKSTAARNAGFDRVLADEMIVVRRAAEGFEVWGTPFWSPERRHPLDPGRAPLSVLARLVQATAPAATPLGWAEASAWLLSSVVLYDTDPEVRAAVFGLACDVAESARCVRLAFPKEGPWLCKLNARSSTPPTTGPSPSRSTGT